MNANEQLIRKIAEEMAIESYPGTWQPAIESLIEQFTPAAQIAVKHIEANERKWLSAAGGRWTREEIEKRLIKMGLIPPTEKEVTNE